MAHRSNQAVASQEQAAPQPPDDPPPARRVLLGWTTALAALGLSTAGVFGALWLLRVPIASFFIGAALADRGAEADFEIVNLDLSHLVIADLRVGSETSPDVSVPSIEARWAWNGLTPRLQALLITDPRVRLRVGEDGRVSAGSLDRLSEGTPGRRRASIPAIELEIVNGVAEINAPFGALTATFNASGRIGEDFQARGRIEETSQAAGEHALNGGRADFVIASREGALAAQLNANAVSLRWGDTTFEQASLRVSARAPLDLASYEAEAAWRIASLESPNVSARQLSGGVGGEAVANETNLQPQEWQGQARVNAGETVLSGNAMRSVRFDARLEGDASNGGARWSLGAENFAGLAMQAPRLTANGDLTFGLTGATRAEGSARATLSQARLNAEAQATLADAFPNIAEAPIGPTFASAERALLNAARRFDITAPLALSIDSSATRIRVSAPVEARAASGTVLRLAPLRGDAPALVMHWPGAALHGAVELTLSGGGAPRATLLLDTVDWSPGSPFEADGTLTLADWRAENASIATSELAVGLAIAPDGSGRLDLRGPATITGPVGDGEVRDMVAALDLGVLWSQGWRVVPNGCVPIRMSGLDAAGLSFSNGAFSLCAAGDALIAADANRNLSGGFSIRTLALNGRMAGPEAQPAQLAADVLSGQFRGVTDDITLALQAARPRLNIVMGDERTLALALQSATANARIGNGTWSVEGAFEQGTLNDQSLPGIVSTIAGQWRAAPRNGQGPVIEVTSGEALLTAHEPESDDERPLFNPMRLVNVNAVLSDGEVNANGAIVLDESGQQLAAFTALHDIGDGAGTTRISAASVTFDETLQPYNITERARGMVENVRGSASVVADVAWSREATTATGTISTTGVSFATATMPVVQDVRGAIYFDDLFNLTTPPGQSATIGLINPGLAARNGRIRFQLLPEQRVGIEQAEFEFASGVLAMSPTVVRLGEDETRIELTLRDVDAADLIANLNVPDLAATGRVEGTFPLRLTRQTAFIEGGVLRSQGDGGILSYTGSAGDSVEGFSRVAFDALRRFSYDSLTLTLDGDLNGEVLSSIEFSGRNSGEPVELSDMTAIPGIGSVRVRGVPFDFNVRISAPFRSLARTAATITDPGSLIDQARGDEVDIEATPAPEPVDPDAPGTR